MAGLIADDLHKGYADADGRLRPVLGGVSLRVAPGQIVCLIGRSGAGKTTLMNILAGVLRPNAGNVSWDSAATFPGAAPQIRLPDRLPGRPPNGYMPQKNILLPWLTLRDNVAVPLRLAGWPRERSRAMACERLDEVMLGGFERHYPHQVSGGMARRACLARVLTLRQPLLLLDEPFTGVDYDLELRLEKMLKDLVRRTDAAALVVTHNIETALAVGDRVDILALRPSGAVISASHSSGDLAGCDPISARRHPDFGTRFADVLDAYREGDEGPAKAARSPQTSQQDTQIPCG